jgi:hypothetical protein
MLDKVVVDLDHGGQTPQLSKLQDFRKIEIKTTRGPEKSIRRVLAIFKQTTY